MNTVNTNINIIPNIEENHFNIHNSYLEIEFVVSNNVGGVFANDANVRLVSRCVPSIDPSNDNRINVQKGLKKRIILILVIVKGDILKECTQCY